MAIDITIPDHRSRLSVALRRSFTDKAPQRRIRQNLLEIYRDKCNTAFETEMTESQELGTLLNLFQKFVRGHMLSLAYYAPRWAIDSRTVDGQGFDTKMQAMLTRYSEILNFNKLQKKLALDSAFGWAVAKVDNGLAPKGITAPVAPRVYRINPDMLIIDPTADEVDTCSYIGDIYLVPLNEAKEHPGFNEEQRAKLQEYRNDSDSAQTYDTDGLTDTDRYAEPMTRILDVYIPKSGVIYSWPAPDDDFRNVASDEPLGERPSEINPYCLLNLLMMPGNLVELSRLRSLRGLHLVANEMLIKGVEQARASQRNPVAPLGSEQDMSTALNAGDNNPIFLEDKEKLGMYVIPGPDTSILNLGASTAQLFSSEAGNLEVALGASAGADTARQTEALIGQITASQSLDRKAFEEFLAEIGKKLLILAYPNEELEIESVLRIPGTKIEVSQLWEGPSKMPRMAPIGDFNFNIVPYSTAFRTPQEKVKQLNEASQMVLQFFMAKQQGAPFALEAIMDSVSEAFDLVPDLLEWWDGEEPSAIEKTQNTYTSMAKEATGSDINYNGKQGGDQQAFAEAAPQAGGMQ